MNSVCTHTATSGVERLRYGGHDDDDDDDDDDEVVIIPSNERKQAWTQERTRRPEHHELYVRDGTRYLPHEEAKQTSPYEPAPGQNGCRCLPLSCCTTVSRHVEQHVPFRSTCYIYECFRQRLLILILIVFISCIPACHPNQYHTAV